MIGDTFTEKRLVLLNGDGFRLEVEDVRLVRWTSYFLTERAIPMNVNTILILLHNTIQALSRTSELDHSYCTLDSELRGPSWCYISTDDIEARFSVFAL